MNKNKKNETEFGIRYSKFPFGRRLIIDAENQSIE